MPGSCGVITVSEVTEIRQCTVQGSIIINTFIIHFLIQFSYNFFYKIIYGTFKYTYNNDIQITIMYRSLSKQYHQMQNIAA